jgi:hypothetical protein
MTSLSATVKKILSWITEAVNYLKGELESIFKIILLL